MTDWEKIKIGEVLLKIPKGYLKVKTSEYLTKGKYPVVDQGYNFISGYTDDESYLYSGDLPLVIFGDHTRILKYINFNFAIGADGTQVLIPNKTLFTTRYFHYALKNLNFQSYGYERHFKHLKEQYISRPPLPIQQKIASLLSAYDDLIELNERRIKVLEDIAGLIYKEWFVKFRFPGYEKAKMIESELGMIPEGWEAKKVEEVVERIHPGKLYDSNTVKKSGKVPVLDQGRSGIIGYHDDEPGVRASEDNPTIVFANHTCYQNLILFSFSAIQNVLPFIPSETNFRNIFWLYWATKGLVKFNDYKGHWPEFINKKLIVPLSNICEKFGEIIKPIAILSYKLQQQNQLLRQTRDMLLPKLISGEIDVSDLDIKAN